MTWQHPAMLWLLPALGALVGLYTLALRHRPARGAVAYPLWLVAEASTHAGRTHRHLPAGLFLLALAAIVIGTARPVVSWATPTGTPVVIIIDVSRSMEEHDVLPSRIEASKMAAIEFVNRLPRQSRVALVSFGSFVTVNVPLTADRQVLREGIRNLTTQLRTQLGTGLVAGVRAVTGEGGGWPGAGFTSPSPESAPPARAPSSPDRPRAIAILLSDGRASDGIPPMDAAQEARRRGVRVHTVGVATTKDPTKLRSGYWGVLDDDTLRAIAAETGGRYYHADAAGRLREIYRELARAVGWESRPIEVTAVAGVVAMALLVASVVLRYAVYQIH
jgi:Ca-activated chloride channel family protein